MKCGRAAAPERAAALPIKMGSTTQAESLDDRAVARDLGLLQVVQQPTTLADEQQQATTAVVVVLVGLEVLREMRDAEAQQSDLDLGGTGVTLGRGVLSDDLLLGLRVGTNRHAGLLPVSLRGAPGPVHPGTLDPRPLDGDVACAPRERGQPVKIISAPAPDRIAVPAHTTGGSSRRSDTVCEPSAWR